MSGLIRKITFWPRKKTYAICGLVVGLTLAAVGLLLQWLAQQVGFETSLVPRHLLASAATALVAGVSLFWVGRTVGHQEDRLQALSMRDPLTDLFNRATLNDRIETELKRASRGDNPLALILVDLDGLKSVNDRYGHVAGDAAIVHVANALKHACRSTDIAFRIGGDEFAVLAPDTNQKQAINLTERIQKGVALFPVTVGTERIRVSVSIGVADVAPAAGMSVTELLSAADRLLYEAKANGKNRVVLDAITNTPDTAQQSASLRRRAHSIRSTRRRLQCNVLRSARIDEMWKKISQRRRVS